MPLNHAHWTFNRAFFPWLIPHGDIHNAVCTLRAVSCPDFDLVGAMIAQGTSAMGTGRRMQTLWSQSCFCNHLSTTPPDSSWITHGDCIKFMYLNTTAVVRYVKACKSVFICMYISYTSIPSLCRQSFRNLSQTWDCCYFIRAPQMSSAMFWHLISQ